MITIPKLNESLIQQANSNSFNGTRGNSSEASYLAKAEKILSWDISDNKKEQLLKLWHEKYTKLLRLEANHISTMYAGAGNYNTKWDKSDKIFETGAEIFHWFDNIEEQANRKEYMEVELLENKIRWGFEDNYPTNDKWRKLAKIDRQKFNELYEELNNKIPFKKSTIPYKIYHNIEKINQLQKVIILENDDVSIWQDEKTYIKFKMKPKPQLIFALKKKGFYWNAHNGCWQNKKVNIEWLKEFEEMYGEYI